jgi:hypothetical protein
MLKASANWVAEDFNPASFMAWRKRAAKASDSGLGLGFFMPRTLKFSLFQGNGFALTKCQSEYRALHPHRF